MRTCLLCLLLIAALLFVLPGCYRNETTRTSAMGGRPLGVREFDETPRNRASTFVPNTKSRVW